MRSANTRSLALTGLFTALILTATAYLPRIPTVNGYAHIGDTFIYLAASLLPAPQAALAAGLGGMLADVLTGYGQWAPFTLIIKMCLTLPFTARQPRLWCGRNIIAAAVALPITVGGYYAAAWLLTGSGLAPLAEVPANALQAGVSMLFYLILAHRLDKAGFKNLLNNKPR
jgi:uncharacterized repeat protein (TIGR04002 family)